MKPHTKLHVLAFVLAGALGCLGCRLYNLQVTRHDELRSLAEDNTQRSFWREPIRGQVLDAKGTPLAMSLPVKVVCADPSALGDRQQYVAHALAPLLETNEAWIAGRLAPRIRSDGKTNKFVVLKRKVPVETWLKIQCTMTNLDLGLDETKLTKKEKRFYSELRHSAIFSKEDQLRVYPNHNLASHVVGYVGYMPRQSTPAGVKSTNNVITATAVTEDSVELETGLNGIEMAFNSKLAGVRGWRRTERDSHGHELLSYREQDVEPRNGLNIVLTIDAGLQHIVETELAEGMRKNSPVSISCIVVRPRTGEILAMATLPNFDPNAPQNSAMASLRNRVICDIAEPGSTFKIVPVSAALNEHAVSLDTLFDCEKGHFFFAGKTLHDHEPYGLLSVADIIKKSSNIGAAKVGIKLGEDKLYHYIQGYGFGSRTGIQLPGEVGGILPPVKRWSGVSIAQIPMGQGVAVTPLQTVMAMSAIANHGLLMRPMVVDRLVDEDGKVVAKYDPQPIKQIISEEAAKQMVIALKKVPTQEGTAVAARMDNYTVAGKTGTAQKVENGKYVQKFFASFIGFLPADNPELCISVVMDGPSQGGHYGGRVSGPVFKAIAQRAVNYLNIKPDIQPELEPESNAALGSTNAASLKNEGQGADD